MSVSSEIDRLLRHSWLARAQPFIRARAPWLHKTLLVGRNVVLPFRSRHGLTRYQHAAIERFLAFSPDLSGAILEIGSDLKAAVLLELASRDLDNLIGLNVDLDFSQVALHRAGNGPREYEIVQGDARQLPFKDATISSILSMMAFEHIHNLDLALQEMHRVLKPGGLVYSNFGPIWSCSIGHHVYAVVDGVEARHWKPGRNPVPHYAHLLMTSTEFRTAVCRQSWVFPKLADAIVQWTYEGAGVNRFFYEDYVNFFNASPFRVRHLAPVREHVPRKIQERLENSWPGYRNFSVRMVEVVLQKT